MLEIPLRGQAPAGSLCLVVSLATDRPVYLDDPDDSQKKKSIIENSKNGYCSLVASYYLSITTLKVKKVEVLNRAI